MEWTNTKEAMQSIADETARRAKFNLGAVRPIRDNDGKIRSRRQDASGRLRNSIVPGKVQTFGNTLAVNVAPKMLYYGQFQDLGVKGTKDAPLNPTPFAFKNEGVGGQMLDSISVWAKNWRRIRFRDDAGRFKKFTPASLKSLAYVIARSIKRKGIAQSYFLTEPINEMREEMPGLLEAAIQKDIENYLNNLSKE